MSASFSNNFDNKEDSPLINALSRHIGEYYSDGKDMSIEAKIDESDYTDRDKRGNSQ